MRPVFAQQPLLAGVLAVSLLIWRVMEGVVDFRSFRRLRAGARRQDRGSQALLIITITLGAALGVVAAYRVPGATITTNVVGRDILFWLGVALIYAGITFRLYAIHTLGAYFTTAVAIAPQQTVIDSGPYRLIRHPAYTGVLIILLGFALTCTNWLSLLLIPAGALLGLGYRMRVEERTLQEQLGKPYQEYMRHTKRLIPFVL
ncbi:MAG TPA: isoprenylcysteine carboxylmethyltransferase family protein [Ktedonobacterales bacterium]|jgi:protein-S-isoprenylcysteine O-methyltransferase Ste14|nr:isoprenylcysteine carboxylmethyltransferase family protein [Ktedonobacterales bacterium]